MELLTVILLILLVIFILVIGIFILYTFLDGHIRNFIYHHAKRDAKHIGKHVANDKYSNDGYPNHYYANNGSNTDKVNERIMKENEYIKHLNNEIVRKQIMEHNEKYS